MPTVQERIASRLTKLFESPEQYARRKKSIEGQQEFRWITIGGEQDGDKEHAGGTHVQIRSSTGEIVKGPDALTGKKVDELGKSKDKPAPRDVDRDRAVANLPIDKRGYGSIDSQIDRWKRENKAADRQKAKENAAENRTDKAESRRLFEQHGRAMAEKVAAKTGRKVSEVLKFIDGKVKWEPKEAIKLLGGWAADQEKLEDSEQASQWSEAKSEPTGTAKDPDFDPSQAVKVSADDITKLRQADVFRVVEWTPNEHRQSVVDYITKERPDLAEEASDVMEELGGSPKSDDKDSVTFQTAGGAVCEVCQAICTRPAAKPVWRRLTYGTAVTIQHCQAISEGRAERSRHEDCGPHWRSTRRQGDGFSGRPDNPASRGITARAENDVLWNRISRSVRKEVDYSRQEGPRE